LEAFGERKPLVEWARDPRCVVKYGTLANRLIQGWDAEQAITQPLEQRGRNFSKPKKTITAFGETKSVAEWVEDSRVTVAANVFLRRIQHGWSPESSLTSAVTSNRLKRDSNATLYEAFGEEKTLREWVIDERCQVSEMTLRKNVNSGMDLEQALQHRRKPGRHFIGAHDEFTGEVNEVKAALSMLAEGGELWVYATTDSSRISLIFKDVRHSVTDDLFRTLSEGRLVAKAFETDTVKLFELTGDGRAALL
jgi:hypothetical protein